MINFFFPEEENKKGPSKIELLRKSISNTKGVERFIFLSLTLIFVLSSLSVLWKTNQLLMVDIPKKGGLLNEGVIGSPRYINPLLAISDADRDISSLVYSGLLKISLDGSLKPDLAKEYSISENGLEYHFILKDEIHFHDGYSVTADDVLFTISKAQDPNLKSPKRPNFEGVTVEKISDKEIKITLKQPYAPFLESMTLGILPRHLWKDISTEQFAFADLNINPVGSGPYKIASIKKNSAGVPLSITLSSFKKYALGAPYIQKIVMKFYQNEKSLSDAYTKGEIESMNAISPELAAYLKINGENVLNKTLPRIFAVFFNQNQAPLFANKEVRQALDISLDKEAIINSVLKGYGKAIDSPIPEGIIKKSKQDTSTTTNSLIEKSSSTTTLSRYEKATNILEKNGWKKNPDSGIYEKTVKKAVSRLSFSISTSNAPELKAVAEIIKSEWQKIGAEVDLKVFDISDLNQNIIRPRKYDALLFGEIIGRDMDLFAFWHSSQRNDPGLNIALYTNIKTDKILEDARKMLVEENRTDAYLKFEEEIKKDIPAVFVYSPDFIYILPSKIMGFSLGPITVPSERFLEVHNWYIETERVWKIFGDK